MFYNYKLKDDFINHLIERDKASHKLYNKIFNSSARTEEELNRDLCTFTKEDLLKLFNRLAKNLKNVTMINYNFLIKEYKIYCTSLKIDNVNLDILETKNIKSIKSEKEYTILSEDDFNRIMSIEPENSEMNVLLVLRIVWETDARPKFLKILELKIQDIDAENNLAYIDGNFYQLSSKLINDIVKWANTKDVYVHKKGTYELATMDENNGYVFRKIKMSNSKLGKPMTLTNFDNALNKWSNRYLDGDVLTIKDLYMSLALKYMLIHHKTHTEMFTEQRYFQKTLSFVYQNVFNTYAKTKYPELYNEYVDYFVELGKKYNYYV